MEKANIPRMLMHIPSLQLENFFYKSVYEAEKASWAVPGGAKHSRLPQGTSGTLSVVVV